MNRVISLIFILTILIYSSSCDTIKEEPTVSTGEGYFSVIQFASDQWDTYHGHAFSINKKVYFNGNVDSSYITTLDMNWGTVLKMFFETDISDGKYLDQYEFSYFRDATTMTDNYYYEAKDKSLYTKKLQIMANYYTDKIKSIYIEAGRDSKIGSKSIKLFYVPLDVISIQEMETSKAGEKKEMRIEYDFMQ